MKNEKEFYDSLKIATKSLEKKVNFQESLNSSWSKRKKEIKYHRKSQNEKILIFLQKGYSITPLIALNLFGCLRLSARVCYLRGQGYTIDSVRYKVPRSKKIVAKYTLKR